MLESIAPLLEEITNKSITPGVFPQDFKEALVNTLVKKIILDHLNKKNLFSSLQSFFWIQTCGMGDCRSTSVIPAYLKPHGT